MVHADAYYSPVKEEEEEEVEQAGKGVSIPCAVEVEGGRATGGDEAKHGAVAALLLAAKSPCPRRPSSCSWAIYICGLCIADLTTATRTRKTFQDSVDRHVDRPHEFQLSPSRDQLVLMRTAGRWFPVSWFTGAGWDGFG
ncbi:hypothetical protein BHM03_00004060 [Ensete ventricosum]|nr:hypothetical protein BHM03_00004060 [Ensete ventricosum]